MTPDQEITLWTAAITAIPTMLFTGVVAYWTWKRDQERIIVQKSPTYWETLDGTEKDAAPCGVGIVVKNLSLYPVRIAGLGFRMAGKHAFAFEQDQHEMQWPLEVASHARMTIYMTDEEWRRLVDSLGNRIKILDRRFVAVAVSETGARFASNRLSVSIMRPFRTVRRWVEKVTGH